MRTQEKVNINGVQLFIWYLKYTLEKYLKNQKIVFRPTVNQYIVLKFQNMYMQNAPVLMNLYLARNY
jgi:hypothetical protein